PDTALSATATYNGTSMTLLATVHANQSGGAGPYGGILDVFGLTSAPTGAHTVEVDVTGGYAVVTGGSESFTNVTSFGTASTTSGTCGGPTCNISTPSITTTSG